MVEDLLCSNTLSLVFYPLLWWKQLSRLTRYPSCLQYTPPINATMASTPTTAVSAPSSIRKSTAISVVGPAPCPLLCTPPHAPPYTPLRTPPHTLTRTLPRALPRTGDEFRASWTSTQAMMVPSKSTCSSEDLAEFFLHNVRKHHGPPNTITSGRGLQFASRFWKALCERPGIEVRLSTGFHPQADGQTERFNVPWRNTCGFT